MLFFKFAKISRPASCAQPNGTFCYACNDRGKVVVEEDQGGCLLRDVRRGLVHRNAEVGLLQGRTVVDAVSRHADNVSFALEPRHNFKLVARRCPGKDDLPLAHHGIPVAVGKGRQLVAVHDNCLVLVIGD